MELKNIMPYYQGDGHTVLLKSGDLAFCYKMEGMEVGTFTKEDALLANEVWENALRLFDQDFVLQQQTVKKPCYFSAANPEFPTYLNQTVKQYFDGKEYWSVVTYLFVIRVNNPVASTYSRSVDLGNVKPKFDVDSVANRVSTFASVLEKGGFKLHPMPYDEVCNLLQLYLNGFQEGVFADLSFKERIIMGSARKMGIMAVNSDECLPSSVIPFAVNKELSSEGVSLYGDLFVQFTIGLKASHVLNTIIFIENQNEWRKKLEKKSKNLKSLAAMSKANKRMADDNDAFIEATYAGRGKMVVRAHVNIMYWADDDVSLKRVENQVVTASVGMNFTLNMSHSLNQKTLFFASMPGNGGFLAEGETFETHGHIASALLKKETIIDRSAGKPSTHGLQVTDRVLGIPVYRDSWFEPYNTKKITARNSAKIGATGGGKTVNVINDLYQYWCMGFYISCIDIGKSLEVICKLVKGNYVIYKEGMSLGINPFAVHTARLSANKIEFICDFLAMLWQPGIELGATQRSALEEVIIHAYGAVKSREEMDYSMSIDGKAYTFAKFYEWVSANRELVNNLTANDKQFFNIDSFLLTTKQFYDGKYSNLFLEGQGLNYLDVNNRFTVWEMDNVVDHPTLFPIFSMLITNLTLEVMWSREGVNKFFWFEEAWKVATKPGMAAFFRYMLKTVRKFDGGFGVSIQELGDLDVPGTTLIDAFISNTDVWDFTIHKPAQSLAVAERLRWITPEKPTDLRYDLLRSIRNDLSGSYPYMERLNIIGSDAKVVRTMLTPQQVAAFMSDKNDKAKLMPFVEAAGGDIELGIDNYVRAKRR